MTSPTAPIAINVGCSLGFTATAPSTVALAIAPPRARSGGAPVDEYLAVTGPDQQPVAVDELDTPNGRVQIVAVPTGPFHVSYHAEVPTHPGPTPESTTVPGLDADTLTAMRQSRYCPSDALEGFAVATFGPEASTATTARAVADWVKSHLTYEPGWSGPLDTAVDTLLTHRGVCRDFAHLAIALCRALRIPARLAAVYAPGLTPMDFHAVVEVATENGWEVLDPTRMAPRQSLVRISTGRDAADTAFATTIVGDVGLDTAEVTAVVDGDLPIDDHASVVSLA